MSLILRCQACGQSWSSATSGYDCPNGPHDQDNPLVIVAVLLAVVLVVGPILAWLLHALGPMLLTAAHAYLSLWPPEFRYVGCCQ